LKIRVFEQLPDYQVLWSNTRIREKFRLLPLLASSPTATAERVVTLILIPSLLVGEDANKGSNKKMMHTI